MLTNESLEHKFNSELSKVNTDRMDVYGHPAENFDRAEKMQMLVEDCKDIQLRHVLKAVIVKVARLVVSPTHFDSWLDIAGYAKCAILILERRRVERDGKQQQHRSNSITSN